jgi:hypothetical protein
MEDRVLAQTQNDPGEHDHEDGGGSGQMSTTDTLPPPYSTG